MLVVLSGGAGPAAGRRGQLPDRVREEAGEGTGDQSPSSHHSVQEVRAGTHRAVGVGSQLGAPSPSGGGGQTAF